VNIVAENVRLNLSQFARIEMFTSYVQALLLPDPDGDSGTAFHRFFLALTLN
jgi:hypothetical protein